MPAPKLMVFRLPDLSDIPTCVPSDTGMRAVMRYVILQYVYYS